MDIKTLVKAVISTLSLLFITGTVSYTGIYGLFVLIILYFIYNAIEIDKNIFVKFTAGVFGIFAVLHLFQVNVYDQILGEYYLASQIIITLIIAAGIYLFMEALLSLLYHIFDLDWTGSEIKIKPLFIFLGSFILLVMIYLPVWMMEYPSNVSADTLDQIGQILSGSYVNHHPFVHTLWLRFLMCFSDEINTRVGIAALLQLISCAAVFAFVVRTVYVKTRKFSYGLLTFLFYSVLSFHAFYSITLIKDVTHASIACIFISLLIYYFDEEKPVWNLVYLILIGLFSIFFCLFRTNGYYAYVLMLLAAVWYTIKKKDKLLIIVFVVAFVASTLIKGPLYDSMGIARVSYAESLSVPAQQIALVIKNGHKLDKEDMDTLKKVIDVSKAAESYDVFLSDPIKNLLKAGDITYLEEHKMDYFKLWLKIGTEHPFEYMQAWVDQWSGYMSPHYYSTSIFWGVWDNSYGIKASPRLVTGELNDGLHDLAYTQHDLPLIGWFHYPSLYTWLLFIMIGYVLRCKDTEGLLIVAPLLGIFLTLVISCPFNLCFRYYYAVICCLPLFIMKPLLYRKEEADGSVLDSDTDL